jgi:4-hydroxythreonine-4-phosphate dehydrogenase
MHRVNGKVFFIADCESQDDLHLAVTAGMQAPCRFLWVGSAGLGIAVADYLAKSQTQKPLSPIADAPVMFVIGSTHLATARQKRALLDITGAVEVRPGPETIGIARHALCDKRHLVVSIAPVNPSDLSLQQFFVSLEGIPIAAIFLTGGDTALEYVRVATEMCLMGKAHGMVTAPVNKEAVTMSGIPFSGHTEYIARLCGTPDSRMMLSNAMLNVIHVTTHVSLRNAIEAPTGRILRTIEVGNEAMKLLGCEHPRIAMCGINPHAGEHGLFGIEDAERIIPAIEAARATGVLVDGPHAPDTVFMRAIRGEYDMVVAMYHDQGHIPMKLIDFEHTVNVTLGIPIIRTSVDHGTAFDIAGKNKASPQNMIAALRMGVALASRKLAGCQTELGQKD